VEGLRLLASDRILSAETTFISAIARFDVLIQVGNWNCIVFDDIVQGHKARKQNAGINVLVRVCNSIHVYYPVRST
jgi:hypothetical protein